MAHELPPLPYSKDALEPHISAETLDYHHDKHHAGYVKKLNGAIDGTEYEDMPLEKIITSTGEGGIFNNAAQVWNHTFYWQCMSPDGGGEPEGELGNAIRNAFGSTDQFKEQFNDAVTTLFGSGWVWLVRTADGGLAIEQAPERPQSAGNRSHAAAYLRHLGTRVLYRLPQRQRQLSERILAGGELGLRRSQLPGRVKRASTVRDSTREAPGLEVACVSPRRALAGTTVAFTH